MHISPVTAVLLLQLYILQVGKKNHALSYRVKGVFCYPSMSQPQPPVKYHRTLDTYSLKGDTFHYQCIIRSYHIETKDNSLFSCLLYHYGNLFTLHDTNLIISYSDYFVMSSGF